MIAAGSPASAQDDPGFGSYMVTLRQQALAEGVSVRTADAVFPGLTLNPRVIELDRGQPGATNTSSAIPAFAPYPSQHVDAARIARGRQTYL
ncbi:MAG: lytic murein transglycosylase, partial [Sphingomonas sp.]